MKLYVIAVSFKNEIEVEELKILKETAKRFTFVGDNKAGRILIDKNEINKINTQFTPYIICDNVSTGMDKLKAYYLNEVEILNRKMKFLKEMLNKIGGHLNG